MGADFRWNVGQGAEGAGGSGGATMLMTIWKVVGGSMAEVIFSTLIVYWYAHPILSTIYILSTPETFAIPRHRVCDLNWDCGYTLRLHYIYLKSG